MKYYAIINKQKVGPMELPALVDAGLKPDDYVWCKGMDDWQQAKDVADICRYFRQRIFDKMHPGSAPAPEGQAAGAPDPAGDYTDEDFAHMKRKEANQVIGQKVMEARQRLEQDPDIEEPPVTWYPFPLILSAIVFFPLGIPAVIHARRAIRFWQQGHRAEAHQEARTAKMYGGIALALGLIAVGALIRILS